MLPDQAFGIWSSAAEAARAVVDFHWIAPDVCVEIAGMVPNQGSLAPEAAGAVEDHHALAPDEAVVAVFLDFYLLDVPVEVCHFVLLLD
jgi:hypothetical protein